MCVDARNRGSLGSDALAEGGAECLEAFRDDAVPDPQGAFVAGDEAGVDEDLHVVADGGLGAAGGFDEVACAHLAVGRRGDARQHAQPGGVGQGGERPGECLGLILVQDVGGDRYTAQLLVDRRGGGSGAHGPIISKSVNEKY
jgi:hypothetical protein